MALCTLKDYWPLDLRPASPASGSSPGEPAKVPPIPIAIPIEAGAPVTLCQHTGKVPYGRKKDAMKHMESLARMNPDCILNVYVCRWCYSWHVGRLAS